MRLITDFLGTPEPQEDWEWQCHADSPLLERYDFMSIICTRPEGHEGPHMGAFEIEPGEEDIVGPVWED